MGASASGGQCGGAAEVSSYRCQLFPTQQANLHTPHRETTAYRQENCKSVSKTFSNDRGNRLLPRIPESFEGTCVGKQIREELTNLHSIVDCGTV